MQEVRTHKGDNALIVVAGNKIDSETRLRLIYIIKSREVTTEEGMKFAHENKSTYVETSAKTGENISAMFKDIAEAIIGNESRPTPENAAAGGIGILSGL